MANNRKKKLTLKEAEAITGPLSDWGQYENFTPPNIVDLQQLGRFIRENGISPTEAINIIKKYKFKETGSDSRRDWKMFRFTMYIWQRYKEKLAIGRGKLPTKLVSITAVVRSVNFKKLYQAYPNPAVISEQKEVLNLLKLIGDKRQNSAFKEGNFKIEGTNKSMTQGQIDELR